MNRRVAIDRKGSRSTPVRAGRPKKKGRPKNRYEIEAETASTSASAKRLREEESSTEVPMQASHGYRILNFLTVFSAISELVKCKTCGGNVRFLESAIRGLGFKLVIVCEKDCEKRYVTSCPSTGNHAYEINRRFVFAMRLLGVGMDGIKKFCGIMDLPGAFHRNVYDGAVKNIHCAAKAVAEILFRKAIDKEKGLVADAENVAESSGVTVSGNSTWRKTGSSSLQGVATLAGYRTGKVVDVIAKSSSCEECEDWSERIETAEYEDWMESHEDRCPCNREGISAGMEADGIMAMFERSEDLHRTKYVNYVGASETFDAVAESKPYGESTTLAKKECVFNVRKRMRRRLREATNFPGGREKIGGKIIDKLTTCYVTAIKKNAGSPLPDMKKAVWASLLHESSTDEKPRHENCPPGSDSWCSWCRAKADGKLNEYKHKPPLGEDVFQAIRPVYEEFSRDDLVERCLGGSDREIGNERLNSMIWSIAPEQMFAGLEIVEIASYVAASIFNKGYKSLLLILHTMNVIVGPKAHAMCMEEDSDRCSFSGSETSEEGGKRRRKN